MKLHCFGCHPCRFDLSNWSREERHCYTKMIVNALKARYHTIANTVKVCCWAIVNIVKAHCCASVNVVKVRCCKIVSAGCMMVLIVLMRS